MSVGGGVGVVLLAVLAACFSERAWLRVACYVYVGVFVLGHVVAVALGYLPSERLLVPILISLFACFVIEVKRKYDKW